MSEPGELRWVYSCSGASSAAQMANYIAVKLDRLEAAEMSCFAGVGGDVRPLVRTAKSGRPIIALDGCPLHCAAQILKRHGLKADQHCDLSRLGVKKKYHEDFDTEEAKRLLAQTAGEAASLSNLSEAPESAEEEGPELSSPVCYLRDFQTEQPD